MGTVATNFVEAKPGLNLKNITLAGGGYDSTSTNMVPFSGVFACIDKIAKKAHRIICILHWWELLLRIMAIRYISAVTGPLAMGKKLNPFVTSPHREVKKKSAP